MVSGEKGGSGIVIVRYAVKITTLNAGRLSPSAMFPFPDGSVMSERIDGVDWRYFAENGAVTIGCHGADSLNHPDIWVAAVDTNALSGVVRIPERIGGLPVRKIGKGAFQGCKNVTKFIVPEGVTHCEARAFARCAQLKLIIYPKSLVWLGEGQVYRSPVVEAIGFFGKPPKCDFAQCPFKGCAYGAKIAIPYDNRILWRNVGEMDPYLCNDGCHAMRCLIKLSKAERALAKRMHAGFIRAEFPSDRPAKDDIDVDELHNLCDEVWRKANKDGAIGENIFMPEVYNDVCYNHARYVSSSGHGPFFAYATMMYFNAGVDVFFRFKFWHQTALLVDDTIVCGPSIQPTWRRWWMSEPCHFDKSGWHRLTIVSRGRLGYDDYKMDGELGGVYYKHGDDKDWRRFEATPDGKTFRVTPDDIRRAIADIDRAKKQK